MEQISIEELSQNTDAVVARVQNGETFEITKHGRVIARMVPVVSHRPDDRSATAAADEPSPTS